jgi:hypothetical protein
MARSRLSLISAAVLACVAVLAAIPRGSPRAYAQDDEEGYHLFFHLDVPPALVGVTLSDDGSKNTYNGILRGTLGGVAITDARYTYTNGASQFVGGGTFTMITMAGPVEAGRILMTGDAKSITLTFFGTYLGARVSFSLVGPSEQVGGTSVDATGLADTTFRSHEQYIAAVRQTASGLSETVRAQVVAQADQNPRLVREYQQRPR